MSPIDGNVIPESSDEYIENSFDKRDSDTGQITKFLL